MITDEELFAKANKWLTTSDLQNWKTDQSALGFVASVCLQHRTGKPISEKQKDYVYAILARCYNEG